MAIKKEQTLWVSSIEPETIGGNSYIPTALVYGEGSDISFGKNAEKLEASGALANRNLKIELGEVVPGGSIENRRKFPINNGDPKTAFELTRDYFSKILEPVEATLKKTEAGKYSARIIVAEPLSFQVSNFSGNWISNYRDNIRRMLSNYEEVDFLPEPFAVYQYYRYGQRIPHLQDQTKNIAFIVDFGGGTFDACVIESTNTGDISQSSKHSKPLSADSSPIGGFVINKKIANYLIKRDLEDKQKKVADKYLDQFYRVERGELAEDGLRDEARMFFSNMRRLLKDVEQIKIELVSKITNWNLKGDQYEKVVINKPANPFKDQTLHTSEFLGHQLRTVFEQKIWEKHLKKTISNVLDRASEALNTRKINITLISGGSANIKWLEKLLLRDFSEQLADADPVPISHSFQEVVANGLAIECARRFYEPESEFVAVTYNPVKLYLDPDESGTNYSKRYKSIGDKIDMSEAKNFDLIPAAQSLKHFFDEPLQWRVKLSKSPRHHLDYFFSRPETDDYRDCYNVESTRVNTTDNTKFDGHIKIELAVREDGTAIPRFIYQTGNKEHKIPENSETGSPFYLDMTSDSEIITEASGYIGLDFGTSNSSVCLLNNERIKVTARRESDQSWRNLSSSISSLPYPVAVTLRTYLQSKAEATDSCALARECFECCLTFMAYAALAELNKHGEIKGLVKSFPHRSMGPLKFLLCESIKKLKNKAVFSAGLSDILKPKNIKLLDSAIKDFTNHKHDKITAEFDYHGHLNFIVSILHSSLKDMAFGYATNFVPQDFSEYEFKGQFMVSHDNYPFLENFSYQSNTALKPSEALLVMRSSGKYLTLSPLIFWWESQDQDLGKKCYWYDMPPSSNSGAMVKQCGSKSAIEANSLHPGLEASFKELETGSEVLFRTGEILISEDEEQ